MDHNDHIREIKTVASALADAIRNIKSDLDLKEVSRIKAMLADTIEGSISHSLEMLSDEPEEAEVEESE